MSFRVGEDVGGYRFVNVLGGDGSAITYEVENLELKRREHLKLLPGELNSDPDVVERFLREAAIHSKLHHPGIAEFYRGFELNGQMVMTTEAIDGRPLESRLAEGPLALIESIDIAIATLSGLAYAHEYDVIHREVTPQTIYLTSVGGVKLTGFGLARQAADPRLTAPGTMLGSIYYMSPEQVKGLGELDCRSDIYSLGVVLYEMIAGSRPFESRSQFDVIQAHVMKPPPPLEDLREDLPASLCEAVMHSLEKFPDERFESAVEFREALEATRRDVQSAQATPRQLKVRAPMEDLEDAVREKKAEPLVIPSRKANRQAKGKAEEPASASPEAAASPPPQGKKESTAPVSSPVLPAGSPGGGGAAATWDEETEGWKTCDLIVVGALTFIMVIALVMAALVLFDK